MKLFVSPPPGFYAVGHEQVHALLICETKVEDLQGYLGTLASRSGWTPDKALLVLDIAWIGLLIFSRMGDLKAAHRGHLGGCKLVNRTGRMYTAHALIQGRDALPLDQTARS